VLFNRNSRGNVNLFFHRSAVFFDYIYFDGKFRQNVEDYLDTKKCKIDCLNHSLFTLKYKEIVNCKLCNQVGDMIEESEIESFIFYLYIGDFESAKLKDNTTTIKDSIKLPYRNKGKLDTLKCFSCESPKYLELKTILTEPPKIVVINLVLSSIDKKTIVNLLESLDDEIKISDLFELKNTKYKKLSFKFKGMILYKGKHYIYCGFYYNVNYWVLINDEKIDKFSSWRNLRNHLIKNNWIPILLFYEDSDNVIDDDDDDNEISEYEEFINDLKSGKI